MRNEAISKIVMPQLKIVGNLTQIIHFIGLAHTKIQISTK